MVGTDELDSPVDILIYGKPNAWHPIRNAKDGIVDGSPFGGRGGRFVFLVDYGRLFGLTFGCRHLSLLFSIATALWPLKLCPPRSPNRQSQLIRLCGGLQVRQLLRQLLRAN